MIPKEQLLAFLEGRYIPQPDGAWGYDYGFESGYNQALRDIKHEFDL